MGKDQETTETTNFMVSRRRLQPVPIQSTTTEPPHKQGPSLSFSRCWYAIVLVAVAGIVGFFAMASNFVEKDNHANAVSEATSLVATATPIVGSPSRWADQTLYSTAKSNLTLLSGNLDSVSTQAIETAVKSLKEALNQRQDVEAAAVTAELAKQASRRLTVNESKSWAKCHPEASSDYCNVGVWVSNLSDATIPLGETAWADTSPESYPADHYTCEGLKACPKDVAPGQSLHVQFQVFMKTNGATQLSVQGAGLGSNNLQAKTAWALIKNF